MQIGNETAFRSWIEQQGLSVDYSMVTGLGPGPFTDVEIPGAYRRVVHIVDLLLRPLVTLMQSSAAGIMVPQYDVWGEEASREIFEKLRVPAGAPIGDFPFTLLDAGEYDDLYHLFLLAALGAWDVWTVSAGGSYVLRLNHDGFCAIASPGSELAANVDSELRASRFDVMKRDKIR